MSPQGLVLPANSILVAGVPIIVEYEIGANATEAQMLAGRLVVFDTVCYAVKEASSGEAVVGVLMEQPEELEAHTYTVADQQKVIVGPMGCIVKVLLTSGDVSCGAKLEAAANGLVQQYTAGPGVGLAFTDADAQIAPAEILMRLGLEVG